MSKIDIEQQAINALNFVQKLYIEIAYLIKEVEGQLGEKQEEFAIGRPSGYGVTSGKSTGLEPDNVKLWLGNSFTVFFIAGGDHEKETKQTNTAFKESLKLLFLDIELGIQNNGKPTIRAGVLYDIKRKNRFKKFEEAMSHIFSYNRKKLIVSGDKLDYEDSYISMKGEVFSLPLFSVESPEDVNTKIVQPMLSVYRDSILVQSRGNNGLSEPNISKMVETKSTDN